jgi:hypothetical protein
MILEESNDLFNLRIVTYTVEDGGKFEYYYIILY